MLTANEELKQDAHATENAEEMDFSILSDVQGEVPDRADEAGAEDYDRRLDALAESADPVTRLTRKTIRHCQTVQFRRFRENLSDMIEIGKGTSINDALENLRRKNLSKPKLYLLSFATFYRI